MEALPAVNAKREMTDRLVKWIGQQGLKRTFASIADDTGLDEKTIRNNTIIDMLPNRDKKTVVNYLYNL